MYFRALTIRLFVVPSLANSFTVYPETKGVPLEEMDAVFGEGKTTTTCLPNVMCNLCLQRN